MRIQFVAATLMACALTTVTFGQFTSDMPRGEFEAVSIDSGPQANPADVPATVYKDLVQAAGAAWIRIYFGDQTRLGPGSFIRLTSLRDNEVQELDYWALSMWQNSSAYFNGDSILVELIAGPDTGNNRVAIDEVALEIGFALPIGGCGICGADNRVPSEENFSCRLLPAGCSASVYNDLSCLVSAGHCMGGNMVVQFNVPDSNGDCSLNNPPVADQFPVTDQIYMNGGVGNDWAAMLSGTNNLGETIYERFGEARPIAPSAPNNGNSLNIWGYGVDEQCTRSQRQQTSGGSVTSVSGSYFEHNVDATFGNSGSGVIRNGTILGIATHCPCNNVATRIDLNAFENARANLCSNESACCFIDGSCTEVSAEDCGAAGGVAQGVGSNCNTPEICPAAFGACCYPNELCVFSEQNECVNSGGTFQGFGVTCSAGLCDLPTGACCIAGDACVEVAGADCASFGGDYQGDGSGCSPNPCVDPVDCPEDVNGNGEVEFNDLVTLLANWGPCVGCPADINGNGEVEFNDLVMLLAAWGPCD